MNAILLYNIQYEFEISRTHGRFFFSSTIYTQKLIYIKNCVDTFSHGEEKEMREQRQQLGNLSYV